MTMGALVLPLIILYKLWYARRDSDNKNHDNINQEQDSTSSVVISSNMPGSEDFENNSITITQQQDSTSPPNNNIIQEPDSTPQSENSDNNNIIQEPDSWSHSENSNNNNIIQENSSYSLSLPSVEYEVFLSFRGPDTRSHITDILYRFLIHSKIHTFKDDDEMRKGEGIWPTLVKAINHSKIYIPILSENYAHSKWCLKELAEIVQRQKQDNRRIILPIFYMVDPSDVRHQSGPYQKAFQQHEQTFGAPTVKIWKDALNEVGTLKGWHVKSNNDIYAHIWSHISKDNYTLDTDELVGIDDHIEVLLEKLSVDTENVTMVGIHGLGGIGKTTIAKAVYNTISSRFDRCCFVENIRETQQQNDDIDDNGGRKMIRERVSKFKVLIILDDVDEKFKFEEIIGSPKDFTPGSRFIVTSRNSKVLSILNDNQCKLYEVGSMSHSRSLKLFSKHAFRKNSPPPNYKTLAEDIVSTTGGLPLTLKVIGSLLFQEETSVWKEKLKQLQGTLELQVMDRLRISYDTLSYESQQIFLDIACLFIGANKEMAFYMWSDCNFYPTSNLNILIQRSMIKIGSDNVFQMHDQLRDMGREIIRQEDKEQPWRRSRLWSDEEGTVELLSNNNKGTNHVKAVRVSPNSTIVELRSEYFTSLSGLRYFEANHKKLLGNFSNLFPSLRWLQLQYHKDESEDFTNLMMTNLVILDLESSTITDTLGACINMANKLKVLNLKYCYSPRNFPIFPESSNLEILDLSYFHCDDDNKLLDAENLKKLIVLKLAHCTLRKIIGGTIAEMKELRELDLTGFFCENLREALTDVGDLPSLKILKQLGAKERIGSETPQEEVLSGIKVTPITNLAEMLELEELTVEDCQHGIDIPPSVMITDEEGVHLWWKVSKLKLLKLCYTKMNGGTVNFSYLLPSSLRGLHVWLCEELSWLPSLENLENLTKLHINKCPSLLEIQFGDGGLKSLQFVEISTSGVTQIHGLGHLLSSPDCKLQELNIWNCSDLTGVLSFHLPLEDQRAVESLQELSINGCPMLEVGPIVRGLSKFPRLKKLVLGYQIKITEKEEMEAIGSLEELDELRLCLPPSIERIASLSKLQKLRVLSIRESSSLREVVGLGDLNSLELLQIRDCPSLERLLPPADQRSSSCLQNLRIRDIANCGKLNDNEISGLGTSRTNDPKLWWNYDEYPFNPASFFEGPFPWVTWEEEI
ncbi:Disease resistance protein L6 [Linum perenne]